MTAQPDEKLDDELVHAMSLLKLTERYDAIQAWHKAKLIAIKAQLPEKEEPSYGDGWDKWSEGHLVGANGVLDQVTKIIDTELENEG